MHKNSRKFAALGQETKYGLPSAPSRFQNSSLEQGMKETSPALIVVDQQGFVHEVITLSRALALHALSALRDLESLEGLNGSNAQLLIDPETVDLWDRPGSSREMSDGRIRRILRTYGNQILLFSTNRDRRLNQRFLSLGASGLLHKTATSKELFARLESLWSKRRMTPALCQHSRQRRYHLDRIEAGRETPRRLRRHLSRRQAEVLSLLKQGLPNKQISSELGLSLSTVKTHVSAILRAIGANSRAHAAFKASSSDF